MNSEAQRASLEISHFTLLMLWKKFTETEHSSNFITNSPILFRLYWLKRIVLHYHSTLKICIKHKIMYNIVLCQHKTRSTSTFGILDGFSNYLVYELKKANIWSTWLHKRYVPGPTRPPYMGHGPVGTLPFTLKRLPSVCCCAAIGNPQTPEVFKKTSLPWGATQPAGACGDTGQPFLKGHIIY